MKEENLVEIIFCYTSGGKEAKLILLEDSFSEGAVLRNVRFQCPYEGDCPNKYEESYCLKKKNS